MSRALIILCLLALTTASLTTRAESAERLAASLLEERDPGVIDPIDECLDDGVALTSDSSSHPLVGLTSGLAASIFDDWTGAIAPRLSAHEMRVRPRGAVFWPSLSRHRRMSWLQTYVI